MDLQDEKQIPKKTSRDALKIAYNSNGTDIKYIKQIKMCLKHISYSIKSKKQNDSTHIF